MNTQLQTIGINEATEHRKLGVRQPDVTSCRRGGSVPGQSRHAVALYDRDSEANKQDTGVNRASGSTAVRKQPV